jgi:predicted metalloprotease with PDZ domain
MIAALALLLPLSGTGHPSTLAPPAIRSVASGTYLVRFASADYSTAHVDATIPVDGSVVMSSIRDESLKDGWATFVSNLVMKTPDGKAISFAKSDKARWTFATPYRGPLVLSYDVDLSFARKPWPTGNQTAAYYNGSALFVVGRALFIYSGELGDAEVTFDVPSGAEVVTSWKETAPRVFRTKGPLLILHNLVDNTFVVGRFVHRTVESNGFRLNICLLDSAAQAAPIVTETVHRILNQFTRIFNGGDQGVYQITIFSASGEGGESYLSSFAEVTANPLTRESAITWGNTLGHEFFHYWNGFRITGGLENYQSTQWFSEGFTEYYANLALVRAGIIDLQEWLSLVQLHASVYRLFKRGAPYDADLTLPDAGKQKAKNTVALYDGGAYIAFALDAIIRNATKNERSLDDVMRYLDHHLNEPTPGTLRTEDVSAAVRSATGVDVDGFMSKYVRGNQSLDPKEAFANAGLRAAVDGYKVILAPDCAAPEQARITLRRLVGKPVACSSRR